jgi:hypothetical protein
MRPRHGGLVSGVQPQVNSNTPVPPVQGRLRGLQGLCVKFLALVPTPAPNTMRWWALWCLAIWWAPWLAVAASLLNK